MADKNARTKRYSEQFKLQAAKLIVEGGYTYRQASEQLGVSDWALRCWVKAFRASGHVAPKGQVVPLAQELKAPRRELTRLIPVALCTPRVCILSAALVSISTPASVWSSPGC